MLTHLYGAVLGINKSWGGLPHNRDHSTEVQFIRLLEVPKSKATPPSTVAVSITSKSIYHIALQCVGRAPCHHHFPFLTTPWSRLGVRPWCHAGPHPQPQSLIGQRLPASTSRARPLPRLHPIGEADQIYNYPYAMIIYIIKW